jgi:hypothetical protein
MEQQQPQRPPPHHPKLRGLTGFVVLNAALRRLVSREGAGRAFKRRASVGECFLASVGLGGIFRGLIQVLYRYGMYGAEGSNRHARMVETTV